MSAPELAQLEMLAQVDELVGRLNQWAEGDSPWEPLNRSRALVRRLLKRVETLRVRLEAPLVVAMFGGTGTGKSTLVNALVGRESTPAGRQRPTTTRPVLVVHPQTELEALGLPLEEFDVSQVDAPILRDIVIIDCPDPDTTETDVGRTILTGVSGEPNVGRTILSGDATQPRQTDKSVRPTTETDKSVRPTGPPGSNLERLHRLLPYCDVLIYTSTQQKYRSARVGEELGLASTGCRLLFVQTHADLDEDIRDDWRRQLAGHYEVPEMFFVDSLRAFEEQLAGQRPSGDFARLQDLLTTQLTASQRVQIRRANLVDLIHAVLKHCSLQLTQERPKIEQVELALDEQRVRLTAAMAEQLRDELLQSRSLWERRLLGAVTDSWGSSPFSSMLRLYNGLGGLIASMGLFRARSSAQMALIGALQGVRWWQARQKELEAESQLQRVATFGLDDAMLRESQFVVSGYLKTAKLDPALVGEAPLDRLRHEAIRVEGNFLADAGRRIDEIIAELAARNSGFFTRAWYELLFGIYVLFVLFRIGKNFFYDTFLREFLNGAALGPATLLTVDFYISAAIFFVLWTGLLVMAFTRRLRRGLRQQIEEMAQQLAEGRLAQGLFPRLEQTCRELELAQSRLEAIAETVGDLRHYIATSPALGAQITPLKEPVIAVPERG